MDGTISRFWTRRTIARTRASVAELIASRCEGFGRDARLRFIVGQVLLLREEATPLKQLARFFFALTALELHAADGGLRPNHVHQIRDAAFEILTRHLIPDSGSTLSFLHGEVHAILARCERHAGNPWGATIGLSRALYSCRTADSDDREPVQGAWARQLLRLGNATQAIAATQDPRVISTALRLARRDEEAEIALANAPWEQAKLTAARTGDVLPLARAVRRTATDYAAEKILEVTLIWRASSTEVDHGLLPKLSVLTRRPDLEWRGHEEALALARVFEAINETKTTVAKRAARLGDALGTVDRLPGIELELLAWAAAARWYARTNAFGLAAVALGRYRMLCWALSDGRVADGLGLAGDLLQKPWFRALAAAPATREAS